VFTAAVLFAFWMLLVDTREEPQLIAGVAVAALGASGSELVRRQRIAEVRVRGRWLARLWRPAASVPRDLVRLTVVAVRAAMPGTRVPSGRLRALEFEPGKVARRREPTAGRSGTARGSAVTVIRRRPSARRQTGASASRRR
jgi:hypothetical protein